MSVVLSSSVMAATGTGHAQAELSNPLAVINDINIDFGTVAIDPAAGPQTISIPRYGGVECPPTYVCSGSKYGRVRIEGSPGTSVTCSVSDSTAVLSDGAGHTIVFDPHFYNQTDVTSALITTGGDQNVTIHGDLFFTGNEPAGIYNTTNAGGSGYTITVNY